MVKRKLDMHERETIISFDKEGNNALIYTHERSWVTHFKRQGLKPNSDNGFGGFEFEVPKDWIRKPLPPRKRGSK